MTTFKCLVILYIFPVGLCLPPGLEWATPEEMTMENYANAIPFPVEAHDPQYNPDDWTFELVEFLLVSPVYKPIILETLGDCVEECKKYSNCAAATWSNPYKFCYFSDFEHGVIESDVDGLVHGTVIYKKVNWADSTCPRAGQTTERDPTTEELLIEEEQATSELETITTVTTLDTTTTSATTSPTSTTTTTTPATTATTTTPTTTSTPSTTTTTTSTPSTTTTITNPRTTTTTTPTITATSITTTSTPITTDPTTTPTTASTTITTTTKTTTTTNSKLETAADKATTKEPTTTDSSLPIQYVSLVRCAVDTINGWQYALKTENFCENSMDAVNICVVASPGSCSLQKYNFNTARIAIIKNGRTTGEPFYVATTEGDCGAHWKLQMTPALAITYESGETVAPGNTDLGLWVWDEKFCQ